MPDRYKSFSELAKEELSGRDFCIRVRVRHGAAVVIAPHGGGIEPGTSEIAEAIAGDDLSFYAFEGTKLTGNRALHITSTRFDEPECVALVTASPRAISVHGEESKRQVIFLGGRDEAILRRVRDSLIARGFSVETHNRASLQGCDRGNICNQGKSGYGVQLELSNGLRRSLFKSLSRTGRTCKTKRFGLFVAAVREGVL